MTALPMVAAGAQAVAGGIGAASTLAGGGYAASAGEAEKAAADYRAKQLETNAGMALASSQRRMLDTQQQKRLATSTAIARGGGSGVDVGVGSPASDIGDIAQRGSYHALMDLYNGRSEATGLMNQAEGARYGGDLSAWSGNMQRRASYLSAAGTLAGSAGSAASTYGMLRYPTQYGRLGAMMYGYG